MFLDYYAILEINFDATKEAIKLAYKKQALKWHPDRNDGIDTTLRMQNINEAYLILNDEEGRHRYNKEYIRYNEHKQHSQTYQDQQEKNEQKKYSKQEKRESVVDDSYVFFDETLNSWMLNARKQAVTLAKQTIADIQGMSIAGGQAIAEAALGGIVKYIVFGIIMLIIFKTCDH